MMNYLVTIPIFLKIFKNEQYRFKLDKIILNFFGLNNNFAINNPNKKHDNIYLEFNVFINKQFVFKIKVLDNQNLFATSKQFYINFSYEKSHKNYFLIYPNYWEFYCFNCLKNQCHSKKIEILGAILASSNQDEIENLLYKLKYFNENEIKDILNQIFAS